MFQQLAPVHVIGGGLAGCEAAFQLVSKQIPVILHEMRPQRMTDAHHTSGLPNLSVPIHFARMMQQPMRLAFCMKKCVISAR